MRLPLRGHLTNFWACAILLDGQKMICIKRRPSRSPCSSFAQSNEEYPWRLKISGRRIPAYMASGRVASNSDGRQDMTIKHPLVQFLALAGNTSTEISGCELTDSSSSGAEVLSASQLRYDMPWRTSDSSVTSQGYYVDFCQALRLCGPLKR